MVNIVDTRFGFFQALYDWFVSNNKTPPEWLTSDNCLDLDYLYHTHSGMKIVSPLVMAMMDESNSLTLNNAKRLASMFWTMFGPNLQKEYAVLSVKYEPAENYRMEERGADGKKESKRTDTTTPNQAAITRTVTQNANSTTTEKIAGFDSNNFENANQTTFNPGTTTETTSYNGNPTVTVNRENDGNKAVNATKDYAGKNVFGTDQYSDTDEHYLRRNGNIGVTTTQQMLESEIDLWQWNFISDYVFKCADKLLTLPIY